MHRRWGAANGLPPAPGPTRTPKITCLRSRAPALPAGRAALNPANPLNPGPRTLQVGKFWEDCFLGPMLGCSADAAHEAALDADMAAHRARSFEVVGVGAARGGAGQRVPTGFGITSVYMKW